MCSLWFKQALERHITQCGLVTSGASVAVHGLDQKVLAAITDLRGRVARYAHQASFTICCKIGAVDCSKGEQMQSYLQRKCAVILVPDVMHKEFERLSVC